MGGRPLVARRALPFLEDLDQLLAPVVADAATDDRRGVPDETRGRGHRRDQVAMHPHDPRVRKHREEIVDLQEVPARLSTQRPVVRSPVDPRGSRRGLRDCQRYRARRRSGDRSSSHAIVHTARRAQTTRCRRRPRGDGCTSGPSTRISWTRRRFGERRSIPRSTRPSFESFVAPPPRKGGSNAHDLEPRGEIPSGAGREHRA